MTAPNPFRPAPAAAPAKKQPPKLSARLKKFLDEGDNSFHQIPELRSEFMAFKATIPANQRDCVEIHERGVEAHKHIVERHNVLAKRVDELTEALAYAREEAAKALDTSISQFTSRKGQEPTDEDMRKKLEHNAKSGGDIREGAKK